MGTCNDGVRVGSPASRGRMMITGRSVAKRQKRFFRFLDPIETRPRLPVPRFGKFDGVGHRVEFVTTVEALDPGPLVVLKVASVN